MKYLKRIRYIPMGIWEGLKEFLNTHARDIENRKRFPKAIIDKGCSFSPDVSIGTASHILKGCVLNFSKIGNYSYVGENSLLQNVTMGNYCSIAHGVNMGLGKHPIDLVSTSPLFYRKKNTFKIQVVSEDLDFQEYEPIRLGSDVWVGARATIMDGVTIGTGAVIATGAVVTKDVPPYAIVGGVPAKTIKYRFTEEIRGQLLSSGWWNLAPELALEFIKKRYSA